MSSAGPWASPSSGSIVASYYTSKVAPIVDAIPDAVMSAQEKGFARESVLSVIEIRSRDISPLFEQQKDSLIDEDRMPGRLRHRVVLHGRSSIDHRSAGRVVAPLEAGHGRLHSRQSDNQDPEVATRFPDLSQYQPAVPRYWIDRVVPTTTLLGRISCPSPVETTRDCQQQRFPVVLTVALLAGCSSDSDTTRRPGRSSATWRVSTSGVPIPDGQIDDAVGNTMASQTALVWVPVFPGMAVAVVHGGKTVYAKGFGVRELGKSATVDADTVFQLASVSKSVGATVVAHEVGIETVDWDTPVISKLPGFALADPWVTDHLTISDLYTHRSGLPDHAGDGLEDLGYNRAQVLEKLRQLPLNPFRITYESTRTSASGGAEAVAAAAGTDWETLSQNTIYGPLGMTSTSSRFADYQARENRTVGHILEDGKYKVGPVRDADAQSPPVESAPR